MIAINLACCNDFGRAILRRGTPKPTTLFLNHGASSLDFELRAFVPDVNDRMSTIRKINQEINSALHYADIEIPFPQSDLHLRTISKEAVDIRQQNTIREGGVGKGLLQQIHFCKEGVIP